MVNYSCDKCNKIFKLKGDWIRHSNKKNPCKVAPIMVDKSPDLVGNYINYVCNYCEKAFTTQFSLDRHTNNRCKNKKEINIQNIVDKVTTLEQKIDQMQELEKKLVELEKSKNNSNIANIANNNTTINNTTNNNTNNNTYNNTLNNTINNVTINMYGKENLSHLTIKDYKRVFKRCNLSVPEFILLKHFDEDNPENNNIYISNLKSEYVTIYDGDKWIIADKDSTIQNLYDDNCGILIEKFEDLKEQLDANTQNKFNKFIDRHDDQETIDNSKKEIRQVLYNNRHLPIKNKKKGISNILN